MKKLVLASTSPYRKELLGRLCVGFEAVAPPWEEVDLPGAEETAVANAIGKAESLLVRYPDRLIIGSDQAAELDGAVLGKPGSVENAMRQLAMMSGKSVVFYTGLSIAGNGATISVCERFTVKLRELSPLEIYEYVRREMPVNCAGSFMIEGLGITLMESMQGEDYTSLIGLPLIRLTAMLRQKGFDVLAEAAEPKGCAAL